jgi:hypothetical protein
MWPITGYPTKQGKSGFELDAQRSAVTRYIEHYPGRFLNEIHSNRGGVNNIASGRRSGRYFRIKLAFAAERINTIDISSE